MSEPTSNLRATLRAVQPERLVAFVKRKGYTLVTERPNWGALFRSNRESLVVPLNPAAPNFHHAVASLLDCFVAPLRTFDDILAEVERGDLYTVRIGLDAREARHGFIGSDLFRDLGDAIPKMIESSATGIVTGRADNRRASPEASALARQSVVGQTERGSFIVKFYVPRHPTEVALPSDPLEALGRLTVLGITNAVSYFNSEASSITFVPGRLPPPVAATRQFIEAFCSIPLLDHLAVGKATLSVVGDDIGGPIVMPIDPLATSRAKAVKEAQHEALQSTWHTFVGEIARLEKSAPIDVHGERLHSIHLRIKSEGTERLLRVALSRVEYSRAMKFQEEDRRVRIVAQVDKTTKPWHVVSWRQFGPDEPRAGDTNLFGVPIDGAPL